MKVFELCENVFLLVFLFHEVFFVFLLDFFFSITSQLAKNLFKEQETISFSRIAGTFSDIVRTNINIEIQTFMLRGNN